MSPGGLVGVGENELDSDFVRSLWLEPGCLDQPFQGSWWAEGEGSTGARWRWREEAADRREHYPGLTTLRFGPGRKCDPSARDSDAAEFAERLYRLGRVLD